MTKPMPPPPKPQAPPPSDTSSPQSQATGDNSTAGDYNAEVSTQDPAAEPMETDKPDAAADPAA